MQNDLIRELIFTEEFNEFLNSLPEKVKEKFEFVMLIMRTQKVVNNKFVKHLENTEFYEMRISVSSNEYRSIIFAVDGNSFMDSKYVLLLNGFLKKSTKQYKSEVTKARSIMKKMEL